MSSKTQRAPAPRADAGSPIRRRARARIGPDATLRGASLALVAAVLLGGCGLGAGDTPTGVQLLITRDFGARTLHALRAPAAHGQETVMSLLLRNAAVGTRYGGGFVQSIDGQHGGHEGGEPVDWFYYVNGVEASKGAAEVDVHAGDRVWWDLHPWSQTDYIPAIVGSYPEPFRHGIEGLRLPVRVECADPEGEPCRTVATRLREAGVPDARAALGPAEGGQNILRMLVGTWPQVRREPGAQGLERGPAASGVYARLPAAGTTMTLLDPQGRGVRTLGAGAGLIAATRYSEAAPEWIVTGTDPAGVELAAHALDEADLRGHFAVAIAPGRTATAPGRTATAGTVLPLPAPGA